MAELYKNYKGLHHDYSSNAMAIFRACKYGNLKHLKELVAEGADVNDRTLSDRETPLIIAAKYGYVSVVEFLIKMGAHVNYVDALGRTALMVACRLGEWHCVRALLYSWQTDIDKADNGANTALILMSSHLSSIEHLTCMKLLLEQDADVNLKNNIGMSAAMYCAKNSTVGWEAVKMLLKAGADPEAVDDVSENLSMQAASHGHSEMLQWLMDTGINDVTSTNCFGDNALVLALKSGDAKCVDKLLQAGSDPNSLSGQGCYALSIAASVSFDNTLLLLKCGAVPQPSKLYVSRELCIDHVDEINYAFGHCSDLFHPTDIAILHRQFSVANLLSTVSSCFPLYPFYSVSKSKSSCRFTKIVSDCIHVAANSCPGWLNISRQFLSGPSTLLFLSQQVVSNMAGFSIHRQKTLEEFGLPPRLVRNILLEGLEECMFEISL